MSTQLGFFPVQGEVSYSNDWGAPRDGGDRSHQGNDIFAPKGTPVVAVVSGRVEVGTDKLGGKVVRLYGDDGTYYYYAHLDSQVAELHGKRVTAGAVIGTVGNTGNATSTSPHVHFQVHPGGRGKPATNPFPRLQAVEGNAAPLDQTGGVMAAGTQEKPMSFEEELRRNYGAFAGFLDIPEVGDLLRQAVAEDWSIEKLTAGVQQTEWWKSHATSWREMELLERVDPASFNAQLEARKQEVRSIASQLGVNIPDQRIHDIARTSLFYGWNPGDLRRTVAYEQTYSASTTTGLAGVTVGDLERKASQYLPYRLSDDTINFYTTKILSGELPPEAFDEYLQEEAIKQFPGIKAQIEQGQSPRQILDPYFQLAARELGVPMSTIDWRDPKWSKPITRKGPDGQWAPMDYHEWQTEFRKNSIYGWDQGPFAQEVVAELGTGLGRMFGAIG